MKNTKKTGSGRAMRQRGFSLLEMMVSLAILLAVSAGVLQMMFQMSMTQASVNTRSAMHSNTRSVTEMLQQEISQAGRVALPGETTTIGTLVVGATPDTPLTLTVIVDSTEGMFVGMLLVVDAGTNEETVAVTAIPTAGTPGTITASFTANHAVGATIRPTSAFGTGIIMDEAFLEDQTTVAPAWSSDGFTLRMFGDINGDGNMVYLEYICDPEDDGTGTLTRSEAAWDDGVVGTSQVLLSNVLTSRVDPDDLTSDEIPCFAYFGDYNSPVPLNSYALTVGITLSVQGKYPDPQTGNYDRVTKALLQISPRNINMAYQISSELAGADDVVPPTPPVIKTMLGIP